MQAMVTRLTFDDAAAADAELAELKRQADSISAISGFRALYGIRLGPTGVLIVRVLDTPEAIGRSLAGPLRPDLAERFSEPPLRLSGEVVVAVTA